VGEYTKTPGFDHTTEQADELYNFFGKVRPMRAYPLCRVWDSVQATARLLAAALVAWNFKFFRIIGTATAKYLVIQLYVRAAWFTRQ
jgi:rhamnosyltransferase